MWGFMKRMLGGDEKPSQTTEEGERSDIRRPGGLPGGNGESRVADTPAASPAATPVMGDDDHLGKAAVARQPALFTSALIGRLEVAGRWVLAPGSLSTP